MCLLIATTAPALISVMYGHRWQGAVLPTELLALAAIPQLYASPTGAVFQAFGKTARLFRLGLVSSSLTVIAIVIGVPWGVKGVSIAVLVKSWTLLPIPLMPSLRLMELKLAQVVRASMGIALAAIALAGASLGIRKVLDHSVRNGGILAAQVVIGILVYFGVLAFADRGLLRSLTSRLSRQTRPSEEGGSEAEPPAS